MPVAPAVFAVLCELPPPPLQADRENASSTAIAIALRRPMLFERIAILHY
ncbi:hypothetical protein HMPREF0201_01836 [Cedecea davisae DSM 4568]|uniref:Uncharacterized protein n=1 Tax=Cedecea davisae DSM 4568 TaxID=566551 RepID=S3JCG0_9ENTR|nr:hypothetical protein HMPREF0201_01836 [Cedecea davisae DSM 4568]